jgi:transposase InsO family protein
LDFQVDVTVDGRQVRFLNIIDEYTREALATRAARSFTADATVAVLNELVATLGRRPEHIRMDNGPELTAMALADWCRYTEVDPAYIDPGSPWQNGICESFNGRFHDEFLACAQFHTVLEDITHRKTRPYRPQTNGRVERYNRSILEWAYTRPYRSETARRRALPRWLHTSTITTGPTDHSAANHPSAVSLTSVDRTGRDADDWPGWERRKSY